MNEENYSYNDIDHIDLGKWGVFYKYDDNPIAICCSEDDAKLICKALNTQEYIYEHMYDRRSK